MIRLLIGLALALGTWAALRLRAGAPLLGPPGRHRLTLLLLDAPAPIIGFLLFLAPTARPLLAGLGVAALGFGLIVTDTVKRDILDEPVLFADRAELLEVIRHPRLYLAFIGTGLAIAITAAIVAFVAGVVWAEPPLWPVSFARFCLTAVAAAIVGRACFVLPARFAGPLARWYRRLAPTGAPETDTARFGMLGTCMIHATIAHADRAGLQAAARARGALPLPAGQGPIVMIQAESFVDVRAIDPGLADALPHYAALARDAALSGRLTVPCWGANTIRTEIAVLAGLDDAAIGLDRFNPYEHFAQAPLPSLASAARAAGYRTIFVHPYSRTFYSRHTVLPQLGFDRFIDIDAFADAPREGGYVSDAALAGFVADLIAREGPDLFVFVVTMENHGPWDGKHDPLPPDPLPPALAALPDAAAIGRWLRHLRATDAMIAPLRAAIEARGKGWLAFYGDHQPSLAGLFKPPASDDRRTSYAIWSPGAAAAGATEDIAADRLAARLAALMRAD